MEELETEIKAAEFVRRIIIDDAPAPRVGQLVFGEWADFEIKLKGESFVIPTSAMRGALAAQEAFYRGAALITDGKPNINNLSIFEKELLELDFHVVEGSTILQAAAGKLTDGLATAMGNMTGKQLTASAITLILTLGGSSSYRTYANHQIEAQQLQADSQERQELFEFLRDQREHDINVMRAVNEASTSSVLISKIDSLKDDTAKNVIKSLSGHQSEFAGMTLTPDLATDINRMPREASVERVLQGTYAIARVDTTSTKGFRVRVTDVESRETFTAGLEDLLISNATRAAIEGATFDKTPIKARIRVKMIRGAIVDATIIDAAR